jgi:hypothetical protein
VTPRVWSSLRSPPPTIPSTPPWARPKPILAPDGADPESPSPGNSDHVSESSSVSEEDPRARAAEPQRLQAEEAHEQAEDEGRLRPEEEDVLRHRSRANRLACLFELDYDQADNGAFHDTLTRSEIEHKANVAAELRKHAETMRKVREEAARLAAEEGKKRKEHSDDEGGINEENKPVEATQESEAEEADFLLCGDPAGMSVFRSRVGNLSCLPLSASSASELRRAANPSAHRASKKGKTEKQSKKVLTPATKAERAGGFVQRKQYKPRKPKDKPTTPAAEEHKGCCSSSSSSCTHSAYSNPSSSSSSSSCSSTASSQTCSCSALSHSGRLRREVPTSKDENNKRLDMELIEKGLKEQCCGLDCLKHFRTQLGTEQVRELRLCIWRSTRRPKHRRKMVTRTATRRQRVRPLHA